MPSKTLVPVFDSNDADELGAYNILLELLKNVPQAVSEVGLSIVVEGEGNVLRPISADEIASIDSIHGLGKLSIDGVLSRIETKFKG
jgi:hypothetical protein